MTAQPRAAIYVRVSTDQQEADGTSLDTQEARCRQYCAEQGYQVIGVYSDTYSGFELRRPQLDRLREAVRAGAVDVVVCYVVDRLSRNQAHTAILLYDLDEAGARIEFVAEKFEDSAVGRFILSARSFAAEIEREKIKERTERGRRARVESGKMTGQGLPPYGYQWNADRTALLPDPVTAPIARRIFTAVVGGTSLRRLGADLDADGIPTPRGGGYWTHTTLRLILKNPVYMGSAQAFRWRTSKVNGKQHTCLRDEGERVALPAHVAPALVDEATWQAAQAQLAYNRSNMRRLAAQPETHLLRGGFIICASCGSPLFAADNRTYPVYRCQRGQARQWECGFRGSIAATELDRDVWRRVERALQQPALIAEQVARLAARPEPAEVDLSAVDRALAEIARKQANLVRRMSDVDDDNIAAMYQAELASLSRQRQQLEDERARVLVRVEAHRAAMNRLDTLTRICDRIAARLTSATYEQKRLALTALGVQVKVYPADAIPADLDRRYRVEATIDLDADPAGQLSTVPLGNSSASCSIPARSAGPITLRSGVTRWLD